MFKTPNARKDVKIVAMLEDIQKNDSRIGSSVFVYQSMHQDQKRGVHRLRTKMETDRKGR